MKISVLKNLFLAALVLVTAGCENGNPPGSAKSSQPTLQPEPVAAREFEFQYAATIEGLPSNADVRVWFPIAQSNEQQEIEVVKSATPGKLEKNLDATYGNQIGYFQTKPEFGDLVEFSFVYNVHRKEAALDGAQSKLTDEQKKTFLSANSLVPLDGKPQELVKDADIPEDGMVAGKVLYDVVEQHMKYDKSQPGYGNGDAVWACDSQTGNCTDFHSLFISLARSKSIPARFEIGFPIPTDATQGPIGGYHCWAWFHVDGQGWAPVDISEADKHPEMKDYYFGKLTADRVSFSGGRDIVLVPESAGEPLNYFVYPYVEVDGKVWPKEKIKLNFSFRNK